MTRPANENDLPFGVQIWPRNEGSLYADTIGLDLEAPFGDDRLLDEFAWRIIMAAFGGARAVH